MSISELPNASNVLRQNIICTMLSRETRDKLDNIAAFQGVSIAQVLRWTIDATPVELVLRGQQRPDTNGRGETFTVRLTEKQALKLDMIAERSGWNRSQVVRWLIEQIVSEEARPIVLAEQVRERELLKRSMLTKMRKPDRSASYSEA